MSGRIDLGHGVTAEVRRIGETIHGVAYWHPCAAGMSEGWADTKPTWPDGWDLVSVEPLTLSPSLLCRGCGHHGFIREGRWVPA